MSFEVGEPREGPVAEGALIGRRLRYSYCGRCLHVRLRRRGGCSRGGRRQRTPSVRPNVPRGPAHAHLCNTPTNVNNNSLISYT
ncbi:hypothetical protein Pmani_005222 [Petrolisthes manimaculis]|uniref:Uncharacterized protein n=1 Tax=Petrolisthes manimaculis TaxID=1843537 RepID=A0AAE1QF35_9EUCA|nr:hypothetical protein Pmani_005222 [Petrolisthes manimaculis]